MNILYLSAWFPFPLNNGSKLRIYNLLSGLSQKHDVTLISFCDDDEPSFPDELKRICVNIYPIPSRENKPKSIDGLAGFLSVKPRFLANRYDHSVYELISKVIKEGKIDMIIASEWVMADYCSKEWQIPMIFEDVELGVFKGKITNSPTIFHKYRHRFTWFKMKQYISRKIPEFSACTVVSTQEFLLFQEVISEYKNVEIIPNGVDLKKYLGISVDPKPKTLIFTGSFTYGVNYGAMLWFLTEIFPIIKSKEPDVSVIITGDHADLPLPDYSEITLTGMVDDVRPLIGSSWVSLAPILSGGGTRLKILEAMALRTPVVSTSKGAEGLTVENKKDILIADQPREFAEAVICLMRDQDLRRRIVNNAFELIQNKYQWQVILPEFINLAEKCAPEKD